MCTQWSWQDLPGFRFALVRASIRPMRMEHNAHSEPQLGPSPAPVGQNYATYLGTVRWLPKELAPVANSNSHVASLQFNSQKKERKEKNQIEIFLVLPTGFPSTFLIRPAGYIVCVQLSLKGQGRWEPHEAWKNRAKDAIKCCS